MDIRDITIDIFAKVCFFIPHLLLLACIGTTALLCITDNLYYLSKASVILIASALLSIFLIWKGKSVQELSINEETVNNTCQLNIRESTLCKVYAIIFLLAISWLIFAQARDLPFIILSVILFSISAVHLFVRNLKYPTLVLAELFLTAVFFCASEVVCHPYSFMGTVDIMPHEVWVQAILNTGTICTLSQYGSFPLMHIGAATIAALTGFNIHDSLYTLTIIANLIGIPFIYLIAHYFTDSKRVSLFAAFSFLMMFGTLKLATAIFPTGLYIVAFIIFLYLFIKTNIPFVVHLILIILTATYMTLVHHATTLILFAIIAILLACVFLYKRKFSISQIILGFIALGITSACWIYGFRNDIVRIVEERLGWAISNVQIVVDRLTSTPDINQTPSVTPNLGMEGSIVPTTPATTGGKITEALIESLKLEAIADSTIPTFQINCILSVIILFFLIFGLYFILSRKNKLTKLAVIAPLILLFTPFFIYGITDGFDIISNVFLVRRWRYFVRPFFAIVIGIGIAVVMLTLGSTKMKKETVNTTLVVCLVLLVIAGPIINNASDASIFSENIGDDYRKYLTETELNMRTFINDNIPAGSGLVVDFPYCYYYQKSPLYMNYDVQYFEAYIGNTNYLSLFVSNNVLMKENDYVIFRVEGYHSKDLKAYYGHKTGNIVKIIPTEEKLQTFIKNTYHSSQIYSDRDSTILMA